jgi:hypothetical protein
MTTYNYEGARILAPLTITSNEPVYEVETVSLKKQRASQNVQRWEISFNVIGEKSTEVDLFLKSAEGMEDVRTMIMPQLNAVSSAYTLSSSNVPVQAIASAGVTTVYLNTSSITGKLPKGSFFKFSNHSKLYVTTADMVSNNGTVALTFFPKLRAAITGSHTVNTGDSAILTYYRSIDSQTGITFSDGILSSVGTIDLVEAL